MKTSNLFYIMLLYATINLEAKPKKRCGEALLVTTADQTDTISTGGQQPPVATRTTEEFRQSSDVENSPTLPASTLSTVNSAKTSAASSPITPAASLRFYEETSAFHEASLSPTQTSEQQRGLPSKNNSCPDLDKVTHAEVNLLEQEEARKHRNARDVLEHGILDAAVRLRDFTLNAVCSDLTRILYLDDKMELKTHLGTFQDQTKQGEWFTRGLAQAVERKSVDDTTRMLSLIHENRLTHFVPNQHQENAAKLLLTHQKNIIISILSQTLRRSNGGNLSPRSKATEEILLAIMQSYGHGPEQKARASEIITGFKALPQEQQSALPIKK